MALPCAVVLDSKQKWNHPSCPRVDLDGEVSAGESRGKSRHFSFRMSLLSGNTFVTSIWAERTARTWVTPGSMGIRGTDGTYGNGVTWQWPMLWNPRSPRSAPKSARMSVGRWGADLVVYNQQLWTDLRQGPFTGGRDQNGSAPGDFFLHRSLDPWSIQAPPTSSAPDSET